MFRYSAYVLICVVLLNLASTFAALFRICTPVARNWDKSVSGSCGDETALLLWTAIINAALDVIIVVLPVPIVWRLNMAVQKKIAILATFALGLR